MNIVQDTIQVSKIIMNKNWWRKKMIVMEKKMNDYDEDYQQDEKWWWWVRKKVDSHNIYLQLSIYIVTCNSSVGDQYRDVRTANEKKNCQPKVHVYHEWEKNTTLRLRILK